MYSRSVHVNYSHLKNNLNNILVKFWKTTRFKMEVTLLSAYYSVWYPQLHIKHWMLVLRPCIEQITHSAIKRLGNDEFK